MPDYRIIFRPRSSSVPPIIRLRRLLKLALRYMDMTAIEVQEITPGAPQSATVAHDDRRNPPESGGSSILTGTHQRNQSNPRTAYHVPVNPNFDEKRELPERNIRHPHNSQSPERGDADTNSENQRKSAIVSTSTVLAVENSHYPANAEASNGTEPYAGISNRSKRDRIAPTGTAGENSRYDRNKVQP